MAKEPADRPASAKLHEAVKTSMLDSAGATVLSALEAPAADADPKAAREAAFEAKMQAETRVFAIQKVAQVAEGIGAGKDIGATLQTLSQQNGRASGRERVCQYG